MAAVLGGLGAAIIWSAGSIGASRAARGLGPMLTLAWVMLIGLVLTGAILPFSGHASLSPTAIVWLALGGTGNVGGLLLMYRALRIGQLGVVLPIVTTEGGIAAVIAIAGGQPVSAGQGAALAATLIGVVMIAAARVPAADPAAIAPAAEAAVAPPLPEPSNPGAGADPTRQRDRAVGDPARQRDRAVADPTGRHDRAVADPSGHGDRRAAGWAMAGAVSFGIGLYGTGRAGAVLPAVWAVLPPRVVGVAAVTLPLALSGRLRGASRCARWLLLSGVCEVGGFFAYTLGARHGIAIAAVLATLTGAFGTALGRVLFGERLRASQLAGVLVTLVGVATLSALTA